MECNIDLGFNLEINHTNCFRFLSKGFIEFIVSPSLEVCGDVLDRVHYQMAEANARPVVPVSAKATSLVASVASAKSTIAIEGPSEPGSATAGRQPSDRLSERDSQEQQRRQQQQQQEKRRLQTSRTASVTSAPASSGGQSSSATSFVSSETLTSNLRKMIVSSSATIGRKLNISSSSSSAASSQCSSMPAAMATAIQPLQSVRAVKSSNSSRTTGTSQQAERDNDFETRQANYKHPVIQCDSGSSRPKSSNNGSSNQPARDAGSDITSKPEDNPVSSELNIADGRNLALLNSSNSDVSVDSSHSMNNPVNQSSQLSRLGQINEVANKR